MLMGQFSAPQGLMEKYALGNEYQNKGKPVSTLTRHKKNQDTFEYREFRSESNPLAIFHSKHPLLERQWSTYHTHEESISTASWKGQEAYICQEQMIKTKKKEKANKVRAETLQTMFIHTNHFSVFEWE